MSSIYDTWKPLSNYLGKVDAKEALEVLRYYSLYPGNPSELPPRPPDYIEVHPSMFRQNNGVYPWDISVLAREVVLASNDVSLARYKLRQWKDFSKALNYIKSVETAIVNSDIDTENVLRELFRLGHREFAHQMGGLTRQALIRYGMIFSEPDVMPIVQRQTGLSMQQILTIGLAIWSQYQSHAAIYTPTEDWLKLGIKRTDLETFFKVFSKPFSELKQIVKDNHKIDNTFFYQYNPLAAYPLVEFTRDGKTSYVCTSLHNFQARITGGVYYELCNDPTFDNPYGEAFQKYIGRVSEETFKNNSVALYSEETDPTKNKRRCDWIIDQKDSFTLVECKTKRIAIPGYATLETDEQLQKQLDILADAVVQTYGALLVYEGKGYSSPVYPYDSKKRPSICVVTLERWHLFGSVLAMLRDTVLRKLQAKSIDTSIVQRVPFITIDAQEYERLIYLAKECSITDLINEYVDTSRPYHTWEFTSYMNDVAHGKFEEYDYALSHLFDSIFTSEAQTAFVNADRRMQ